MIDGDIDAELEEVDIEGVQYHCEATIIVTNSRGQQPLKVGAVLESGSRVSCESEKLAARLKAHFDETQILSSVRKSAKAKVADGREMSIQDQTLLVDETVLTPWAPVKMNFALAVQPGVHGASIIGSISK